MSNDATTNHPAIGAGVHQMLNETPYTFSRKMNKNGVKDAVVVVIGDTDVPVNVEGIFDDGTLVSDYYSGQTSTVSNGSVSFSSGFDHLLLGIK